LAIPRKLVVGALGLALVAAGTGVASAAQTRQSGGATTVTRHGIIPLRGHNAPRADAGDLEYHDGPIQQSPAVYLVFWGRQWKKDANGVQGYMTDFFTGLGQSDDQWSPVTSQYDGQGASPTFTGSVLQGVWVDSARNAPGHATADQIANEAMRGAAHFGLSADINLQIVVLSPHGTHPDGFNTPGAGFCAWHSIANGIPFTNQPYVLDAGGGCGADTVQGPLDGFSITGGHEFLEAVTDPDTGGGWFDADGEENGDKCAWQNLHTIDLSSGRFVVQPTWSNAIHGCDG